MPLSEPDPIRQVEKIREVMKNLMSSHQAEAVDAMYNFFDWFSFDFQSAAKGTLNMIVDVLPGPRTPLYLLESRMLEAYPLIPLLDNLGLSIGIINYDGVVFWGLNADYDRVPDLKRFAEIIQESFDKIAEAAKEKKKEKRPSLKKGLPKTSSKPIRNQPARA
ncbi:MAG: DUF1298 domain-containing protein [Deltaproteobacteria bacterium]|nr:DUF1298 domain-containing protein [Deltaproteobacteria bacterium]